MAGAARDQRLSTSLPRVGYCKKAFLPKIPNPGPASVCVLALGGFPSAGRVPVLDPCAPTHCINRKHLEEQRPQKQPCVLCTYFNQPSSDKTISSCCPCINLALLTGLAGPPGRHPNTCSEARHSGLRMSEQLINGPIVSAALLPFSSSPGKKMIRVCIWKPAPSLARKAAHLQMSGPGENKERADGKSRATA